MDKKHGLSKGAVDYIYKPFSVEELLYKVDSILKVQFSLKDYNIREMEKRILKALRKNDSIEEYIIFERNFEKYNLSNREREIAWELKKGLTYKEIGGKLDIS